MDWNVILTQYSPVVIRILLIIFSTLGVVYMSGRLLFPSLKDRSKNIIAFIALIVIGFSITLVYDYDAMIISEQPRRTLIKYIADSALYTPISAVFYVVVGWRFYSRMDSLLDKKVGKDSKKRQ